MRAAAGGFGVAIPIAHKYDLPVAKQVEKTCYRPPYLKSVKFWLVERKPVAEW